MYMIWRGKKRRKKRVKLNSNQLKNGCLQEPSSVLQNATFDVPRIIVIVFLRLTHQLTHNKGHYCFIPGLRPIVTGEDLLKLPIIFHNCLSFPSALKSKLA